MIVPARNYDISLHQWAIDLIEKPFKWGTTDCGNLVRQALIIMFDCDLFAKKFARYKDRAGADRALKRVGGSIRKALENAGFVRVRDSSWHTGDIVIIPGNARQNRHENVGVYINRMVLMSHHDKGVHWVPREGLNKRASRLRAGWLNG